jgi:hypothetical protein
MVFSYYLYKYPYKLFWHISNLFGKTIDIAFYCADPLDYEMFQHFSRYLPPVKIIAKNKKSREYFDSKGIKYWRMPVFPKVVIMGRQTPYKFPVSKIKKFGFDHGLYQFKRWTSAKNYNGFDRYFVSSTEQVKIANSMGIKTVEAVGYPKLDGAFNGEITQEYLENLRKSLKINSEKKTILFTCTWDVAGLSAIEKWYNKIEMLTSEYNVLVTVHTWTSPKYINFIKAIKTIEFIETFNITPYLMLADVIVGDYSSILGEFCAFNKPIITFEVKESDRTIPEILSMLKSISYQIKDFDQLKGALQHCLTHPYEKQKNRMDANKIIFYKLDGLAGKRLAESIMSQIN